MFAHSVGAHGDQKVASPDDIYIYIEEGSSASTRWAHSRSPNYVSFCATLSYTFLCINICI